MPMFCSSRKSVDVVPCTSEDGAVAVKRGGSATPHAAGRLESAGDGKQGASSGRDGLHSAPLQRQSSSEMVGVGDRAGVHSASQQRTPPTMGKGAATAMGATFKEPIGEFTIEAASGAPTAADVDAYLEDIMGPRIVKELRADGSKDWSSRVSGLEGLTKLCQKKVAEGMAMPTGRSDVVDAERAALFRGCVTVLSRVLQDKVVPVFLPALALLAEVYSDGFLKPIAKGPLPRAAVAHFAHQLVWRAGSSNVRAREESSSALLKLARCEAVGCGAISPWVLRPLSNSKSAHAAIGRLELLRMILSEFGLGSANGLELREVLAFVLPLCEAASQGARDAAVGIVLDVRSSDEKRAEALIEALRPSVLPMLKARLAPPDAKSLASLSISGRRLPPIGAGDTGDEVLAFNGTPPGTEVKAKARLTAAELGARGPPTARKKTIKAAAKAAIIDDDEDGLLREAEMIVRSNGNESSGHLRFDKEPTDEELMAEILSVK